MYDYILVGAGSAGCVLANRLTEDPATSVLLLEAGGTDETVPEIHDPTKALQLAHTAVDWAYTTEAEPHLNHRKISWPRGKVLATFYQADAHPGAQLQSAEELVEFVRNHIQPYHHPVGTCKMGHDALAVVDEQLRVRGTEGLRVVDASIMPTIVNGNTNAATIMIGEKAADLIKATSSPALKSPVA